MSAPRVTMKDCWRAGFCARGVRKWLAERDLDYRTFVREGLPFDVVEGFGDAMSDLALERARERTDG